jgi:hypothetical protein
MRFLSIFAIFFSFIINSNAAIFSVDALKLSQNNIINKPIFDAEGNARNKKMFNTSLGFIYQNSTSDQSATLGQQVNNLPSLGLNGDFVLNITGKTWVKVYGEGAFNISSPKLSGSDGLSLNSLKNNNYEIQAVVGYDVLSFGIMDVSVYGGLFHKGISHNANFTINNTTASFSTLSSTNFTGAVLGTGITFYEKDFITNVYAEGYLTSTYGNAEATLMNGGVATSTNTDYKSSGLTGGFGVGSSIDIQIVDNIWIKPSIKYQMLLASNLQSNNSSLSGNNNFQSLTFGLGISWR